MKVFFVLARGSSMHMCKGRNKENICVRESSRKNWFVVGEIQEKFYVLEAQAAMFLVIG